MAYAPGQSPAPTPQRECAYCKQIHYTDKRFLDEWICYECETEVRDYFKRLCKSKAEMKAQKIAP